MKVSEYIKDRWVTIGIACLVCLATSVFMIFMGIALPIAAVVEGMIVMGTAAAFFQDCSRKKRYYDGLLRAWDSLEEKSYLSEIVEPPDFYDGKIMYRIVRQSGKYLNDVIAGQQQEMMEYKEYVQTWVHEIKTPIAAQELIIENHKNPVTSSLEEEVLKIEGYVEQMLYYTKSGNLEADYLIQPVNLKTLVMNVIRKNKKMMVGAGILPRLENLEYEVLTDSKWLEFILGQIVMNAVKYCDSKKKPHVSFQAEEKEGMVLLTVADNGIGIPEEDLPKVFKKGFTGENGRKYKKSTGMGLYLCRKLCDKMQIPVEIQSRQGEGTALIFTLKKAHGMLGVSENSFL